MDSANCELFDGVVSYKCQTGTVTGTVNCADRTCIQNGEKEPTSTQGSTKKGTLP